MFLEILSYGIALSFYGNVNELGKNALKLESKHLYNVKIKDNNILETLPLSMTLNPQLLIGNQAPKRFHKPLFK